MFRVVSLCIAIPVAVAASSISFAQSPKEARSVVFSLAAPALDRDGFRSEMKRKDAAGFAPVSIQSAGDGRHAVVWHKDSNLVSWRAHVEKTSAQVDKLQKTLSGQGFVRSFVAGYSRGGSRLFNVIWVKEKRKRARKVHRQLSRTDVRAKMKAYAKLGFSPVDLVPWVHKKKTYYSAVWVKDGRESRYVVGVQRSKWDQAHASHRRAGYALRDIGVVGGRHSGDVRYAGIWVKDGRLKTHFRSMLLERKGLDDALRSKVPENYRIDDIDTAQVGGRSRYSLILRRVSDRNKVVANFKLPSKTKSRLTRLLSGYHSASSKAHSGNVGFFVQNLRNGRYIAFNPDEHFFMSSVRKVLVGAASLRNRFDPTDSDVVKLSREAYRAPPRDPSRSVGGVRYPAISAPGLFSKSALFAAMLTSSDNNAADYFFERWGGQKSMRAMLEGPVGTRDFGELVSKCGQERRSTMAKGGRYRSLRNVRCHVFRRWQSDGSLAWANPSERQLLKGLKPSRADRDWRRHINQHRNAITPRAYGRFWRALSTGKVLSTSQRGELLRHMGRRRGLFGTARFKSAPFESHVAKNGATYRNRAWVVLAFDFNGDDRNYASITPRFSFSWFTEDHAGPKDGRGDAADDLARRIYTIAVSALR